MSGTRTLTRIWVKLMSHPFFPLLFIGKAVETAAFWSIGSATLKEVGVMAVLGVVATVLWALSDSVDVEFDKDSFIGK